MFNTMLILIIFFRILQRKDQVKERRDAVRVLAAERRKALQASLAYRHFSAEADDLDAFIQDKMRMATDQSYKYVQNYFYLFAAKL